MVLTHRHVKTSSIASTGKALIAIGAVFVGVGALFAGYTLISLVGTLSAQGTILSCAYPEGSCLPTVRFRTAAGEEITFQSTLSSSTFTPEGAVTVRYHPDHPQDAQVDPWLLNGIFASAFAGTGLLLALPGLFFFLFRRDAPSARVVDQYYAAFKNQDYATAYRYLNPIMRTPQGERLTLDWFVQRALEYDAADGKVSDYALRGFRSNPPFRDFTLKVTRERRSYKNRLRLREEGDGWRIFSFDLF